MYHMSIIRKYTAALLDLLNEIQVQYKDSNGNIRSCNVPLTFNVKEKSNILIIIFPLIKITGGNPIPCLLHSHS